MGSFGKDPVGASKPRLRGDWLHTTLRFDKTWLDSGSSGFDVVGLEVPGPNSHCVRRGRNLWATGKSRLSLGMERRDADLVGIVERKHLESVLTVAKRVEGRVQEGGKGPGSS